MSDQPNSPTLHPQPAGHPGGYLGQPTDLVIPPPPPPETYVSASAPTARQWPYAAWIVRVAASLVDGLVVMAGAIPYFIGLVLVVGAGQSVSYAGTAADFQAAQSSGGDLGPAAIGLLMMLLGFLLMLGLWLWNRVFTMGRTGQSVGKRVTRTYLVAESTGNPIGAGLCFVREIAHYVDGILWLGYLWPLWDVKRQTFSDKIMGTVVAQAPSSLG